MKHLDLFSGIGGFALAARWMGWQTVGFCEIDEWCQRVLAKNFPGVPIHGDIKTLMADYQGIRQRAGRPRRPNTGREREPKQALQGAIRDGIDLITAGFPCQPYSLAGKRRGQSDDRALGHEAVRLIEQCRPRYAVLENVYGFVSMGLDNLLSDLESIGYQVGAFVIPACAVDAQHRRDRVWIVAHADSEIEPDGAVNAETPGQLVMADAMRSRTAAGLPESVERQKRQSGEPDNSGHARRGSATGGEMGAWLPEPSVGRVANGVPRRVDRLRGLGNAIVPQVAHQIFRSLK